MVDGFKPRRSNRLKHLPKVDYCENKTADGKRKRGALDEEDEYTPSREGTPENQRIPTRAPENQRSPSRRVIRKTCITRSSRQRAIDASQNEGACIISGIKDKSVQQCHVLPRATKPDVLTALEWWWDIKELSVDSRHNQVFRASSFQDACRYAWTYLHTVRADLHALWDRGYIAIMPMPDVTKEYLAKWQDGDRHKVLEDSDEAKIHEYCVIPHPDLVAGAPAPGNSPICEGFTYRFDKVGIIRSHAKPHFMALNAAMKLKENKELWVEALTAFCKRIELEVDASSFVEDVLTLSDVWTAPPPGDAELIMKEEKEQAAEEASSLLDTVSTGEAVTPKHPKAPVGPEALDQDKHPKAKAPKPEGEPCGSNLKLYAAHLAPTGSRCLLSLQDDKSVQGCHVVPRRTDDRRCARVAAWWGLDEFDVDSPFNIFLLRADIHCLWDQGHLMFVPEPHIIDSYLARSVVPIGGASSLAELFAASDVPVYRYCVVAHRDLPDTEEKAAFPRDVKTLAYVESPVPPQFVIYNAGLMLSKSGLEGFRMALDAFYKRHGIDYEAIDVLRNMLALFQRYTNKKPDSTLLHPITQGDLSL
ncbi:predicted protein [Postia placenta Mad-698-R]|uniref:HNH nuclease domain-containing protein n=1 Tax=Postia placenta MAD-698-R-SB12 TaxID=670580 RepID=A0A1X6N505_9APHY|nr:hypothetical protein POSPLADRAFT_1138968 [Postia placenta MAD-698-R-SB12]EED79455.1 predicted protein [Postia placenta Mad-698-R]OSX63688.1 hypothetical protein POSPLADRAFT_1138968 [Postia placenta MAD-698-R-SB12]